jgi:hypothetical protein
MGTGVAGRGQRVVGGFGRSRSRRYFGVAAVGAGSDHGRSPGDGGSRVVAVAVGGKPVVVVG